MVGVHQRKRLAPENTVPVELAAIGQHLSEAEIIADRPEQADAPALENLGRIDRIGRRDVDAFVETLLPEG